MLLSRQYVKAGFTSGVRGNLLLIGDDFRWKRCDGTIQEVDLAYDLVMDGETCGNIKSFLLSGEGSFFYR